MPERDYEKTDVTIFVAPFGFGPLGKAMAIAQAFERENISCKILTDDIGLKIVESVGLKGDVYKYKDELDLGKINTKIAISSMDISTPIIKSNVPLVLFDSLFWLRGTWEKLPNYCEDLYLAQRFFADPQDTAIKAVKSKLVVVDAVLSESFVIDKVNGSESRNRIVLYPGGLKSPHTPLVEQERYLLWVVKAIEKAMKEEGLSTGELSVILPPQLKNSDVHNYLIAAGSEVLSTVKDMSKITNKAKAFVIAPGIETMLEGCAMGNVPLYLPAYIAPHIPQLAALSDAGVGIELCPSFRKDSVKITGDGRDMGLISKDMLNYNSENLYQDRYQNEIVANLVNYLRHPVKMTDRYPLGCQGAEQVVENIVPFLRGDYAFRQAARAVLFDGEKVGLHYVSKWDYYMLPGGGVKDGESELVGLEREIQEELGCRVKIGSAIGEEETYFDKWKQRQLDRCFIAEVVEHSGEKNLSYYEKEEGHEVVWAANLDEAIRLMKSSKLKNLDGKGVVGRDLKFLLAAKRIKKAK